MKSRVTAGVLAILLGGLGVHRFYVGQTGKGILMLLFCFTGIPAIFGLVSGIIWLLGSDEAFDEKYNSQAIQREILASLKDK
jgi:TM2 domain-containing membrane protein YozV